ncbi:hypothetical protein [Mesorhizobium sp. M0207]|uniref:hypothetical protein n=1 Tax=Mesorhizobium sp. M0207 TaxID=2956915 RepID=UPI00333BCBF9
MSLSAAVYKSKKSLEKQFNLSDCEIDADTGEVIASKALNQNFDYADSIAIRVDFGNIAHIKFLSDTIAEKFGDRESILEKLFLYSGGHFGDMIENSYFDKILEELNMLRDSEIIEVRDFSTQVRSLVKAAIKEGNPIVFI